MGLSVMEKGVLVERLPEPVWVVLSRFSWGSGSLSGVGIRTACEPKLCLDLCCRLAQREGKEPSKHTNLLSIIV